MQVKQLKDSSSVARGTVLRPSLFHDLATLLRFAQYFTRADLLVYAWRNGGGVERSFPAILFEAGEKFIERTISGVSRRWRMASSVLPSGIDAEVLREWFLPVV